MCFNEGNWQYFDFTPPFVFATAIKLVCCMKITKTTNTSPPNQGKLFPITPNNKERKKNYKNESRRTGSVFKTVFLGAWHLFFP